MTSMMMKRSGMMNKRMTNTLMMEKRDMALDKRLAFEASQPVKRHSHEASFLSKRDTMKVRPSLKRHSHEASFLAKRESMRNEVQPQLVKRHSHEASFLA